MDIKFNVGDLITVNGTHFMVAGRIDYSAKDKGQWSEFFLVRLSDKVGFWMSVDDKVLLWEPLKNSDLTGYEKVEEGDETVDAVAGYVDCESGDSAEYEDYFNSADNTYVSIEKWSDGTLSEDKNFVSSIISKVESIGCIDARLNPQSSKLGTSRW